MLLIGCFKICGVLNILCKQWRQKLRHNLLFTAQSRRLICSSARHQTSSRRHFGLQIVQTSTQSITRYGAFFSSGCTAGKSKMWTSCDRASLRNWNAWTSAWSSTQSPPNSGVDVFALVWLRRADISSKWYNVPIWQYLLNCMATLKFRLCQMWYDF